MQTNIAVVDTVAVVTNAEHEISSCFYRTTPTVSYYILFAMLVYLFRYTLCRYKM
jgi:hypothetical protein